MSDVIAANTLTVGTSAEFISNYSRQRKIVEERLQGVMQFGVPSTSLTKRYAYYESAPHAKQWIRGEGIPTKGFKSVTFTVTNLDWGIKIPWHRNDREDDQINGLMDRAADAGRSMGTLPERVFFQIITAGTDADLLSSIPNAPDGVALYNGSSRFGDAAGNILTGTGVASSDAVRDDYYSALEKIMAFQDTEGEPLFDETFFSTITCVYGVGNSKVFEEAFLQGRVVEGSATPTNIIQDASRMPTLIASPRITDNDWFVFAGGQAARAVFQQVRRDTEEVVWDAGNSDEAREFKREAIGWNSRAGYGVNIPYSTVQVNN